MVSSEKIQIVNLWWRRGSSRDEPHKPIVPDRRVAAVKLHLAFELRASAPDRIVRIFVQASERAPADGFPFLVRVQIAPDLLSFRRVLFFFFVFHLS